MEQAGAMPDVDGKTRLFAVFGDPIDQVRTPALINPVFARVGANVVSVPFRVTADGFDATWDVFASIANVAGIGITVPHKRSAARRCARLTPVAATVGAVNCARREPDGTTYGALFDGVGFVRGLGPHRERLRGASVMLVGAGGAGSTIAHALIEEDVADLHIVDIDRAAVESAVDMVNRESGRTIAAGAMGDASQYDVLINATPIGLKSDDRFPLSLRELDPRTLVADIASLTQETALLASARAKGCTVSDGVAMIESQIKLIAEFILGEPPGTPVDES